MNIKKKDMQHIGWHRCLKKRYTYKEININNHKGVIGLTIWDKIIEPKVIHYPFEDTLIVADNYKWVEIALGDTNYWFTAMYDDNDNFVQLYVDITLSNNFEDISNPYFYDLFTDVILTRERNVYIVDEDELSLALKEHLITETEYNLAKATTQKVYGYLIENKEEIINYCQEQVKELEKNLK